MTTTGTYVYFCSYFLRFVCGKNGSTVKRFYSLKPMNLHFSGWLLHWNVTYLKVIAIILSRFKNNLNDSIISMLQYNELEMPRRFRIHIKRRDYFPEIRGKRYMYKSLLYCWNKTEQV